MFKALRKNTYRKFQVSKIGGKLKLECEKRIKRKAEELEQLIKEGEKFKESLVGHVGEFNRVVVEHQESVSRSE